MNLLPFLLLATLASSANAQQAVVSFTLINADSNAPIPGYDPLTDGSTLDFTTLPTRNLNIRANTNPSVVGSVRFALDGNSNFRTENVAPYALAGDNSGDYLPWTPPLGGHTLTATPFTEANAGGSAGTPLTIAFTVVETGIPTPTPGPPPTPVPTPEILTFIERDGVVTVEVESAAPADDWATETDIGGYTGDGYFTWRGPDLFSQPGVGVLTYRLQLSRTASYRLRIRNYHDNPDGTLENDCWVRMDDGDWIKLFSPPVGSWNWESNFDFGENDKPPAAYGLGQGIHTFQISGRSQKFRIDRFIFYTDEAPNPMDTTRPQSPTTENGAVTGELRKWHRVTVTFDGPETSEDAAPNPFRDYRLNVTFQRGTTSYVVPGFYAADGNASETGATGGSQWRVHFVPDEEGEWTYVASFRAGTDVAVSLDPNAGEPTAFHGQTGGFTVGPTDKTGSDFRGKGMLRYVGRHQLQFAETGEYYLKGGADSPENFLGYGEFDGTYDIGGIIPNFLHAYSPHVSDWQSGDPTWQGGKGKGIIGALNYLAAQGINSVYFLTYNVDGGDGQDVWPWTSHAERYRFDCSKLDQWEIVFSHMDQRGIQLHVVTQEEENDQGLDAGELGLTRKLYYRELVARFAHHLALIWNLGEENTNTDAQRKAFADYIRSLDPYDHPITFHTHYNTASTFYNSALGYPGFEATSIQGDSSQYNAWTRDLRQRSVDAGRPWCIYGDEQGPAVAKDMSNIGELRRNALWGNLMGGGAGVEWYFGYQGDFGDMQSEDWRVAEPLWTQTRYALRFFQEHLPFWEMAPNNGLFSGAAGALVLAKADQVYAVYLPSGGTGNLNIGEGTYNVKWYNPRSGGELLNGTASTVEGPGPVAIGNPPSDPSQDWVVLVQREGAKATMQVD